MDERRFLDKIRKMKEEGRQIKLTEASDIKKRKEDLLIEWEDAGIDEINLLTEETIVIDKEDSDVQTLEPDEQREEENKFKDIVSKLVKFGKIKVHKENVEWSGHLIREKVDWVFSLDDTVGCYIDTTEFVQLRDETLETLKKLRGYYEVWSDEWSGRLTGTPPTEDEELESVDMGEMPEAGGEEGGFDFGAGGEEGGF
jgi:hypothetical protein